MSDIESDVESVAESEIDDVIEQPDAEAEIIDENDGTENNVEDEDAENDEENDDDEDEDADAENDDDEENDGSIASSVTNANMIMGNNEESDDDESDEESGDEDDNYLQKFDASMQNDIIAEYHPEMLMHNNDEIEIMSRITRDKQGRIIDALHKTLPFITKYETARILGERAKQINAGAQPLIAVDTNIIDGYLIAKMEYDAKAIPFIVKRPMPNGGCEYWKFADLEIL